MQERLWALQQSHGLSENNLNAWCRGQGIFSHHLTQWKAEFCCSNSIQNTPISQEIRELKQKNHALTRELARKEKALAEAAALLILQKKYQTLWGDEEK